VRSVGAIEQLTHMVAAPIAQTSLLALLPGRGTFTTTGQSRLPQLKESYVKIRLAAASVAALAVPIVLPATHALASTAAPASRATITTIKVYGHGHGDYHGYRYGGDHSYGDHSYGDDHGYGDEHSYGGDDDHSYGYGGEHSHGGDEHSYGGDDDQSYGYGGEHSHGYSYGADNGLLNSLSKLGLPFPGLS
jgi:hypothetical protein